MQRSFFISKCITAEAAVALLSSKRESSSNFLIFLIPFLKILTLYVNIKEQQKCWKGLLVGTSRVGNFAVSQPWYISILKAIKLATIPGVTYRTLPNLSLRRLGTEKYP